MKICILGCGAYGSALSTVLIENNNEVYLWTAFEEEAKELNISREPKKLPGIKLDEKIKITSDIKEATQQADFIVLAIPTAYVRTTIQKIKDDIKNIPICIATKGIEQDTCVFVSDIVEEILETKNIAAISGPSFAVDVANKVPVGLTLACENKQITEIIYKAFSNERFKLRTCKDIIGTEICGAVKNVVAIASGILDGMNMPESTIAMLITEEIHDIKKLIKDLNGDGSTVESFAGFGDILLTATSTKSRNFSFGKLVGEEKSKEELENYINTTTIEGLYTLISIKTLIEKRNIEMPIINLLYEIIYENKNPKELVNFLITK